MHVSNADFYTWYPLGLISTLLIIWKRESHLTLRMFCCVHVSVKWDVEVIINGVPFSIKTVEDWSRLLQWSNAMLREDNRVPSSDSESSKSKEE